MKIIICLFLLLTTNAFAEHIRLINVVGEATKSYEPDIAKINLSIWGKGENAKTAQSLNQGQYEQLKKTLDDHKVLSTDIQTIGYELNPDYLYDNKTSTNKIVGYVATQTIRVTLKKVKTVGKFLDDLINESKNLKAGTNVQSISWDLEKRDEIEKTLLIEAVSMAQEQAQVLAKAANVKVKNLYQLTPQGSASPIPMYPNEGMMLKSAGGGRAQSTALFTGEVKVKAEVVAAYEIE
jgi:uncharacterized protein YggE